jgi:nucleoside-diphosphate-sugar epimerase
VDDGWWVRGTDSGFAKYDADEPPAHEVMKVDLRDPAACRRALEVDGGFDEVYQLAADMGGLGFIHSSPLRILRNNALINLHMVQAAADTGARRYFLASSVCVYPDMEPGAAERDESYAYPAQPDNEYGWEKLYAERLVSAYGAAGDLTVRIGRFENCYGPNGAWRGGREKAPAALCRKIAEAEPGAAIEVWGDGSAVRSFIYVADLVDAVLVLMRSSLEGPTNIGHPQRVTVAELVATIAAVSGKSLTTRYVDGPVGVMSRNFSTARIQSLGWKPSHSLADGLALTYPWVEEQVRAAKEASPPGPPVFITTPRSGLLEDDALA